VRNWLTLEPDCKNQAECPAAFLNPEKDFPEIKSIARCLYAPGNLHACKKHAAFNIDGKGLSALSCQAYAFFPYLTSSPDEFPTRIK
jgi:hypothetical protein